MRNYASKVKNNHSSLILKRLMRLARRGGLKINYDVAVGPNDSTITLVVRIWRESLVLVYSLKMVITHQPPFPSQTQLLSRVVSCYHYFLNHNLVSAFKDIVTIYIAIPVTSPIVVFPWRKVNPNRDEQQSKTFTFTII